MIFDLRQSVGVLLANRVRLPTAFRGSPTVKVPVNATRKRQIILFCNIMLKVQLLII